MPYRQLFTPNFNLPRTFVINGKVYKWNGWCLKLVDDAGKAPNRRPNATAAYEIERKAKRIRTGTPPVNVWVVGFLSLSNPLGHVFLMKYKGNGRYEIRDSEVQAGSRAPYASIGSVLSWFGKYNPKYLGWSTECDGRKYAESYTVPKPTPKPKPSPIVIKRKSGRATVIVTALNVRNKPSIKGRVVATYKKGDSFNYDGYTVAEGYTWLTYVSYSGVRRYVAQGKGKVKYVKGGV